MITYGDRERNYGDRDGNYVDGEGIVWKEYNQCIMMIMCMYNTRGLFVCVYGRCDA